MVTGAQHVGVTFASLMSLPPARAPEVAAIEFELGAVDIDTPEDLGRLEDRFTS